MKYDPSRKKSDENVGMLWHHLYCYRAGESNLYLQKSKRFPCMFVGWWAIWLLGSIMVMSRVMDMVCTLTMILSVLTQSYNECLHISYVYIPLFVYMCVCYVHVCGGGDAPEVGFDVFLHHSQTYIFRQNFS